MTSSFWLTVQKAKPPTGAGGNVVGVVTIYGKFTDHWGNPDYAAMNASLLLGLARNGMRFGPPQATISRSRARNLLAGVIDYGVGPPPIFGWSLGGALRLGADWASGSYADEDSTEYYVGSWVPDVVAVAAGGGALRSVGFRGQIGLHDAHHLFPNIGYRSHMQIMGYQKGVKRSHLIHRQRLPFKNWPKRSHDIRF